MVGAKRQAGVGWLDPAPAFISSNTRTWRGTARVPSAAFTMKPYQSIQVGSCRLDILPDLDPQNPREYGDQLCVMKCAHSRYKLGDGNAQPPPPNALVMPLYLYDHSGLTISMKPFNCPWDSGQVGIIYCPIEAALKEFCSGRRGTWDAVTDTGETLRDRVLAAMEGEVKCYDTYLRCDVWGFSIVGPDGKELESMFGYYGIDDCKSEGLAIAKEIDQTIRMEQNSITQFADEVSSQ